MATVRSASPKVVVIEINEVPLRVLRRFSQWRPSSVIGTLLDKSDIFITHATDVSEDFLYPSQSWASFNTGKPYAQHRIHWYNDPKPVEHPFYWQEVAACGHRVGLVNTLHSSPLSRIVHDGKYSFIVPDCFADEASTLPSAYQQFQQVNLQLTRDNARASALSKSILQAAARAARQPSAFGITAKSAKEVASTLLGIAFRSLNKERLRGLQFPLIAEIFIRELVRTDADLSILFTNHIAATMHRYWCALFPQDFPQSPYGADWINRYSTEVLHAVELLDRYLAQLVDYCMSSGRVLVLCSSMGQQANRALRKESVRSEQHDYRLERPKMFIDALAQDLPPFALESGMVPQYSLIFSSTIDAEIACANLQRRTIGGVDLMIDVNQCVLTLSVKPDPTRNSFSIDGRAVAPAALGFAKLSVDDHHSGMHHPEGLLLVFHDNGKYFRGALRNSEIDYLAFAPAMRGLFETS